MNGKMKTMTTIAATAAAVALGALFFLSLVGLGALTIWVIAKAIAGLI